MRTPLRLPARPTMTALASIGTALGQVEAAVHHRLLAPLWRLELQVQGVTLGAGVVTLGRPIVRAEAGSTIRLGDRVTLISRSDATALGVSHPVVLRTMTSSAEISIGDDCGLSGAAIVAALGIEIGARVLVGADVMVVDTDFHPVDEVPRRRRPLPPPQQSDRVVIEDDVFLGARAIVLRGVRIGSGSVIGAGSVVTTSIPAGVVAAGNPCKPLRELKPYP
jgi:acetyltransferase-like isoleucine patch superfamily enzyme